MLHEFEQNERLRRDRDRLSNGSEKVREIAMLSMAQRHQDVTARFRDLPDTTQFASYNFVDQAVILRTVELNDLKDAVAAEDSEKRRALQFDILINSHHEYRHWADMTTSVFGLSWLSQVLSAIPSSDAQLNRPGFQGGPLG